MGKISIRSENRGKSKWAPLEAREKRQAVFDKNVKLKTGKKKFSINNFSAKNTRQNWSTPPKLKAT